MTSSMLTSIEYDVCMLIYVVASYVKVYISITLYYRVAGGESLEPSEPPAAYMPVVWNNLIDPTFHMSHTQYLQL